MRRREFLGVLGGAATTWPLAARAQQTERVRRIGALLGISASDPEAPPRVAAFLSGLHDLGWDDGRNIKIELRFGGSEANSMRAYAKELVSLAPDVILTQSNLALATLLQETRTTPIIFTVIGDPVGSGFIKSLARDLIATPLASQVLSPHWLGNGLRPSRKSHRISNARP
jgi:putative tryptophan/tyrosine transport system substrate-binding protein